MVIRSAAFTPIQPAHSQNQGAQTQPAPASPQTAQMRTAQPASAKQPKPTAATEPSYHPQITPMFAGGSASGSGTSQTLAITPCTEDAPSGATEVDPTDPTQDPGIPIVNKVQAATSQYNDAKAAKDAADKQLQDEMAVVESSLTEEQKAAYTEQYQKEHADVYQAEQDKAAELAAILEDPAVAASADDPAMQSAVKDALTSLAQSSNAKAAVDWVNSHVGGADGAGPNYGLDDAAIAGLFDTAASQVASTGDPGAFEQLIATFNSMNSVVKSMTTVTNIMTSWNEFKTAFDGGKEALDKYFDDLGKSNATDFSKAAKYVFAASGAASGLIKGVDLASKDGMKTLQDWVTLAAGGTEALKNMLKNGDSAFVDAIADATSQRISLQSAEKLASILKVADKALGGLLGAIDVVGGLQTLLDDPNWSNALRSVAALIALSSNPVMLLGSVMLGFIADTLENEATQAAAFDNLKAIGMDETLAHAIAYNAAATALLAGEGGMTAEQIQALMQAQPAAFAYSSTSVAFAQAAVACDLSGEEIIDFANAMASGESGEGAFQQYAADIETADGQGYSDAWIINHLNEGYAGASKYLNDEHPELVEDAGTFSEGEYAYEKATHGGGGGVDTTLTYLGEQDDPAFRAGFIGSAKDRDRLDDLVGQFVSSGDAQDKQALGEAIQDAYDKGVLDKADANAYLDKLGQDPVD